MYEEYTDKQIVEMLVPKLNKATKYCDWRGITEYPGCNENIIKAIAIVYRSAYIRGQLGRSFIIGEKKDKPVNSFKVGDKVRFTGLDINDEEALSNRRFYPPVGTTGQVMEIGGVDYCFVQWPDSITSGDGIWACRNKYLEKIKKEWVPINNDGSNVKKGNSVRCVEEFGHKNNPEYYPAKGVIGKVIKVSNPRWSCFVQWPEGSTSGNDKWYADWCNLEVLVED